LKIFKSTLQTFGTIPPHSLLILDTVFVASAVNVTPRNLNVNQCLPQQGKKGFKFYATPFEVL